MNRSLIVLRQPTPDCLRRLRQAAHGSDRELDAALIHVGILPPGDLAEIRAALVDSTCEVSARRNTDGHNVIHVTSATRATIAIHNDGTVAVIDVAA